MERDKVTLQDIARANRLVLKSIHNVDEADFRDDRPAVSWSLIAAMRDKSIHGYDITDLDEVWRTAEVDVLQLLAMVEPMLPRQESRTESGVDKRLEAHRDGGGFLARFGAQGERKQEAGSIISVQFIKIERIVTEDFCCYLG